MMGESLAAFTSCERWKNHQHSRKMMFLEKVFTILLAPYTRYILSHLHPNRFCLTSTITLRESSCIYCTYQG